MTRVELNERKNSSGVIDKGDKRYIDISVIKGTVVIKLIKIGGEFTIPVLQDSNIKWDLIDYLSIEFISDNGIIEYKLF